MQKDPTIKILEAPTPTQKGVSEATASGTGGLLGAAGRAADLMPFDTGELKSFLAFRIATAKAAERRARWFGGRYYNRVTGEDPEYVPISGANLRQILPIVGISVPDIVVAVGKYALRLDLAQEAFENLNAEVRSN